MSLLIKGIRERPRQGPQHPTGLCKPEVTGPSQPRAMKAQLDRVRACSDNKKLLICRAFMERTGIEPETRVYRQILASLRAGHA